MAISALVVTVVLPGGWHWTNYSNPPNSPLVPEAPTHVSLARRFSVFRQCCNRKAEKENTEYGGGVFYGGSSLGMRGGDWGWGRKWGTELGFTPLGRSQAFAL